MTHSYDYDYFVIGAGSGGVRSARIAANLGAKVGIAETKHIGGTCVNVGCVPKKIMAYAADYHGDFEDAKGYGWDVNTSAKLDWHKFISRKNAEIERLNGIYQNLMDKAGVDYFEGFARFKDAHTIEINHKDGDKIITADKILIATGGTPRRDMIPGEEHTITSNEAFYLEKQPKHIMIIGGGYIGVEFAHIFGGMGSKVTLVHHNQTILRGFDRDIANHLCEQMRAQGVNFAFDNQLKSVEKKGGTLYAHLSGGDVIDCDCILSAIGRIPNVQGLGLKDIGVKQENNGKIIVDIYSQTNVPHIYALGDVVNKMQLTPVAIDQGHRLADRLFGPPQENLKEICYNNVPTAVFSRPPISTVGCTEEEAKEMGHEVKVYSSTFRPMKYILAEREEKTLMKLVVCKESDIVLGVHMIGLDAPEIMQGFAVALNMGATKADFDKTIGIHPTSAEELVTMR
ncbi:MAG: glutathione-disulfide reductase [Alphaproteobacteria bacterium]